MRLRLTALPPGLLERVRTLSPKSVWAADELIVPGPAAIRPAVLDMVRESRAEIRGLTAEEERLDTFYRELVAVRP